MICLLLDQNKKKYLEIILDDIGCNLIIEKLTLLNSLKIIRLDISNQVDYITKQGYKSIKSISFVYCSTEHIANTGYNIKCSVFGLSDLEICVSSDGIQELRCIIEYIKDNVDHVHLFGGADLYTGESNSYQSNNILGAITIYNRMDYWEIIEID